MKRTMVLFAAMIVAIISSMNISAQTAEEIKILDEVVKLFSQGSDELAKSSNGVINKVTANRIGRDIEINMYFASNALNFSALDEGTKNLLKEQMSKSFIDGILSEEDSQMAIDLFKQMKTKFYINLYDTNKNKITKIVDFNNM